MMLKTFVREYCERCGQKDAEIRGNVVWRNMHKCTRPVPGPHAPPQDLPLAHVNFIRNGEVNVSGPIRERRMVKMSP